MDYKQFSAVDFAADQKFIDWVKYPNATNTIFWESYSARNPDQTVILTAARQLVLGWQLTPPIPSAGTQATVWANILAERDHVSLSKSPNKGVLHVFRNYARPLQWAAVLAVVLGIAAYNLLGTFWGTTRYTTHAGETKTVQLPDGSTVVLNANSSIAFPADWTADQPREVSLDGEAFFSVTHQPNHRKFAVITPRRVRVEVLGTVFTVSERAAKTRVVLNAGKVALYTDKRTKPLLMKPGELVEVSASRRQDMIRRRVTPTVYSAWKDNQFVFDNTSLGEVATLIESSFGYTVQFANDSLKTRRITIRLAGRDLALLLESMAEIHDLKIDRQANRIYINQNPVAK